MIAEGTMISDDHFVDTPETKDSRGLSFIHAPDGGGGGGGGGGGDGEVVVVVRWCGHLSNGGVMAVMMAAGEVSCVITGKKEGRKEVKEGSEGRVLTVQSKQWGAKQREKRGVNWEGKY
ncbi:hypothetical protein E2C01_098407 [Portunus trituberculatus]|uniref:Uncharacterized protein n=1 Tax=Portunus trituberculatus TaxID=210409 RepID=A0A5B7JXR2_PORTR|nr:hypothetical protein [Portunus trituberculatus]